MAFKDWMKKKFDATQLSDIAAHGADSGWAGLTYYSDTTKLYTKYKADIWEMLIQDAEDMGENVFEMISHFGGAKNVSDCETFENLMVWYAAERVARELTDAD